MQRIPFVRHALASLLAASLLPACGVEADEELAIDSAEITGGTLLAANDTTYHSVVRMTIQHADLTTSGCTAFKIGDQRFLTAAHCVEDLVPTDKLFLTVRNDGLIDTINDRFEWSAIHVYPSWWSPDQADWERQRDVAMIDVTKLSPGINKATLSSAFVPDKKPGTNPPVATQGTYVGFGCDLTVPSHKFKKQKGTFTAMTLAELAELGGSTVTSWPLGAYLKFVSHDNGGPVDLCEGDSGGPLFVDGKVVGVAAMSNIASYFERVGSIAGWIANPALNELQNGKTGVFVNENSNLCMGIAGASTAENASVAQLYCDHREGLTSSQYWKIKALPGGTTFQIAVGSTGKCLTVSGTSLVQRTCATTAAEQVAQAWTFPGVAAVNDPMWGRVKIKRASANSCIGVSGGSKVSPKNLGIFTCDSTFSQRWAFAH